MTTSSHADQAKVTGRDILIARLRGMADWLAVHPDLPISPFCDVEISVFGQDLDGARGAMASAPGGWRKGTTAASNFISYEHGDYDPEDPARWNVVYRIHVAKDDSTCERVQIGTKFVPEHEEPVFEWKCAPDYEAAEPGYSPQLRAVSDANTDA